MQKNLKSLEECFSFIEFAYNKTVHSTINFSYFEIVHGFNLLTPMDLIPLRRNGKFRWWKEDKDGETTLWGSLTTNREKEMLYASKENKGRK